MLNVHTAAVDGAAVPLRSKTITWHDPHALAAAGRTLSGQEFISQIAQRIPPAPPIAELFGMTLEPGDVARRVVGHTGGGWGIRTPEGVNPTRFPSVRHRPLGESS